MHINEFPEVMNSCRFCFMCRHLSAAGIVSGRESDTARGHALIADFIRMHPEAVKEADYADAIYRSDLSGACRCHCDGYHDGKGYDEIGLLLALRRDIVEAGCAPDKVKALAAALTDSARWEISGNSKVAYFADPASSRRAGEVAAVKAVFAKAEADVAIISGGCIGKSLYVLGFADEAKQVMEKFAEFLKQSGIETLIVGNPAAVDALKNDFARFDVALEVKVISTFCYFTELVESGALKFRGKLGKIAYVQDDFLKNYLKCDCAVKFLTACGAELVNVGTSIEESYCCGEGALVLDRLNPELVDQMAVRAAAQMPAGVPVVTASAYTANVLAGKGVSAVTVNEIAEKQLCW